MKTKNDLVWLIWIGGDCFPILSEKALENVRINMDSGTWTFHDQTIEIGRAVEYAWDIEDTPLGVYDRTNLKHLQQMMIDYRRFAPPRKD